MLRDCDDLYRQNDVLLLSDVFENGRVVFQINYWYYTALGLAWDATLKLTRVKLERLIDPDLLLTVKRGIRGCVFMISTRYGKANKRYREQYVADFRSKYGQFLDANNLYGWALCNPPFPLACIGLNR